MVAANGNAKRLHRPWSSRAVVHDNGRRPPREQPVRDDLDGGPERRRELELAGERRGDDRTGALRGAAGQPLVVLQDVVAAGDL
jgi:hypothetical protein